MATATLTKLQNFIGGEFVDPAEGQTDAGKPRKAFLEDEIPAMVDNLRFFAGRNSHLAPRLRHGYGDGLRTTAGSLE